MPCTIRPNTASSAGILTVFPQQRTTPSPIVVRKVPSVSTRQVHCQWGAPHVQAGQALEDELEATRADAVAQANRLAAQLSAAVHASDCGAEAQRAEAAQLAAELQSTQAELQSASARQAELEEAAAGTQEEAELLQV